MALVKKQASSPSTFVGSNNEEVLDDNEENPFDVRKYPLLSKLNIVEKYIKDAKERFKNSPDKLKEVLDKIKSNCKGIPKPKIKKPPMEIEIEQKSITKKEVVKEEIKEKPVEQTTVINN